MSIIAVYHSDVPVPHDASSYSPSPLTLLGYLATTFLTTHSLFHILAAREARQRSLAEPVFGLAEEREGVVVGRGSNDRRGMVIEMEYRRKSGRAIHEVFYLPTPSKSKDGAVKELGMVGIVLLEDHPLYKAAGGESLLSKGLETESTEESDTTFNLGLTDKQRRDREGVVLPYFDAQKEGGVGEGGRILYDMGEEDDFDEEEDEI